MTDDNALDLHYGRGGLLTAIESGLEALGKDRDSVTLDDLAAVDEFHIGGREASVVFLDRMQLSAGQELLDIGCGLGGPARFVAEHYACRVTGVDLTADYIETGQALCRWTGLDDRVSLKQGSALELPYADGSFDHAYMIHVGMNIEDKLALCSEVHRLLRPAGRFGVYDVMRTGDGDLCFPLPWSSTRETSFVDSLETYKEALRSAGFSIVAESNRRTEALAFFDRQRAKTAVSKNPPLLGLHLVMGAATGQKLANLVANVVAGRAAPIEVIVQKAG